MANLLNTEEYNKILQEKFGEKNIKFKKAEYAPLSEHFEGFAGDHYILTITYLVDNTEKSETFFIKTKPTKHESTKNLLEEAGLNVYEKEIYLYNFLFKEYERYGYDISFAPKSYYCKPAETIAMENLKARGFKLVERTFFYDLNHCKATLKALALYHGNAISYEESKSRELGKVFRLNKDRPELFNEIFFNFDDPNGFGGKFFKASIYCLVKLVDEMPESQEWKESLKEKIEALRLDKTFNKPLPYRTTACHGDLWSNNMLFKYTNDVPVHCCLVDYQLLRHHHPSFDVLAAIHSNTTPDFRKQNQLQLLRYYYSTFEDIIRKNGFQARSILSEEQFLESARYFTPVALIHGVSVRSVVLLPPSVLTSYAKAGAEELNRIMFSEKRFEIIKDGLEKYDGYRKYVMDSMYEIFETLK